VYISCNPATLARDLKLFSEMNYSLVKAEAFDMFPRTAHVETVVCLSNKNAKPRDYVEIGVDAVDYYNIKSAEKDV
jgi:23S rRNA (uracil1939-C5)-methyltransferase